MSISREIYGLGVSVRNKKINDCYGALKESEGWSLTRLKEHQLRSLRDMVRLAYDRSPFYRSKYDAAGFKPAVLKSLDDIKRIPAVTKQEVLSAASSIQISDGSERLYYSETSGSTGTPLVFYRNQEWDAWHNASVMRGYSWHGVNVWERNGYLWGYNIAPEKRLKVRLLDTLQNRFRLFSYQDDEVEAFLKKLQKATYLNGYSSMLYEIAKKVNRRGDSGKYALKMIKGTSEKIFESYQLEVEKAFGKRIVSEYGSAEGGIIAFECSCGKMHVNMETVIVEEEGGEVLLTNLVSKAFPIIRYKIGDYVALGGSEPCRCGLAHETIREVTGRVGAVIFGRHCTYPSLTLYYVFKNLAQRALILNYQAVQEVKGELVVHLESTLSDADTKTLLREFEKYFGNDVHIMIVEGARRLDYTSKKKDFISRVQA